MTVLANVNPTISVNDISRRRQDNLIEFKACTKVVHHCASCDMPNVQVSGGRVVDVSRQVARPIHSMVPEMVEPIGPTRRNSSIYVCKARAAVHALRVELQGR